MENSKDCGKSGKGHKQEEQGTPNHSSRHIYKYVWKGYKNQVRSCGLSNIRSTHIGKEGREDYKSRNDGNKGVKGGNSNAFSKQRALLAYKAAEDSHRAYA